MTDPLSAIVLAGGQSRRLGQDKRALRLGGPHGQLEATVWRAAAIAAEIVVVAGRDGAEVADLLPNVPPGVSIIPDAQLHHGPLGGLCTGLAVIHHDFALVVACDLPFLSVGVLGYLSAAPRDYDLLIPRHADGRLEPLQAVYRQTVRPILEARLAAGRLRLSDAVGDLEAAGLTVQYVSDSDLSSVDPSQRTFFNVNTPSDLQVAKRLIREDERTGPGGSRGGQVG